MAQFEVLSFERVLFEMLNGFGLSFNALQLVTFMDGVDTKPAGNGGGVDVYVVDEERSAEGKDLNDGQVF